MDTRIWDALPQAVRERVDELVTADRMVGAMKEVWEAFGEGGALAGVPRPGGLRACQDLVAARYAVLADRVTRLSPPTVADMAAAIRAEAGRPVVIEALWDGDTQGWMVDVVAVFPPAGGGAVPRDLRLATLRHGSDLRIFNGQAPPWPEAVEARGVGEELAGMFRIPFHFASPEEPDDQASRWWDTR
ncbi:hypothetical protein AB0B50_01040 [Streptomyces sp. NPDC041068]|uniref:hypothetical protein n=1 Tax=Streptomyces sp. NPDC041068 TaxID=3155130 RepID=UPI0033CDBFDD